MRAICRRSSASTASFTRTFQSPNPKPGTSSSKSRRSASTTPRCTCGAAAAPVLLVWTVSIAFPTSTRCTPKRRPTPFYPSGRNTSSGGHQHIVGHEPMNRTGRLGRISLAVDQMCEAEVAPAVKAQMLRELAAWYRTFATRAGNPVIWESRLLTAEDLDARAGRLEQKQDA